MEPQYRCALETIHCEQSKEVIVRMMGPARDYDGEMYPYHLMVAVGKLRSSRQCYLYETYA